MTRYAYILGFVVLLFVPTTARWIGGAGDVGIGTSPGIERLIVITPHDTDIRNEFRWAFGDWHKKKYGQVVELDYLNPGGTNDITRQLDTVYRNIRAAHGGPLPPEDQVHAGIDMVWGGGEYFFDHDLKSRGILRPVEIDPKILAEVFPQPTLAGAKLYDRDIAPDGTVLPPLWVGVCLSSFGIVYNADLFRSLDVPAPKTWADLTDPRLVGCIYLADPTHSATAAVTYSVIVQRSMVDAEEAYFSAHPGINRTPDSLKNDAGYQAALDAGWKVGMRRLELIAANARYFTDSSPQIATQVAFGNAAAGTSVDFYGQVTEELVGPDRETFILPKGATAINADPIAILYGVTGRRLELANHFIEFMLSPEGQRLWILKVGQPGGPRQRALRRPPVRFDLYANQNGWADHVNYFEDAGGFNQRAMWGGMMNNLMPIWAAAWIDDRDVLRECYSEILHVSDPDRRAKLIAELSDLPITRSELTRMGDERRSVEADHNQDADMWKAKQRIAWATKFRDHYRQVAAEANQ